MAKNSTGRVVILEDPDILDCLICLKPLRSPVYQCINGHLACQSCCIKIYKCPSCSLATGSYRCIAIERILESSKTSCGNIKNGCTERVSYLMKSEHEKTCKYSPISCPFPGCSYTGLPKCLYTHVDETHPFYVWPFTFNTVKHISITLVKGVDVDHVLLQERHDKILFILNHVTDPLGTFVSVTCVVRAAPDMQFSYDLTASAGTDSISLKSYVELIPDCSAKPVKEKCLLITNGFHEVVANTTLLDLELKLVIRKVSIVSKICSTRILIYCSLILLYALLLSFFGLYMLWG